MPIAVPRRSSLYISAITAVPTDNPAEDPKAWITRNKSNKGTFGETATPNEPKHNIGNEDRYTIRRPPFVRTCMDNRQ